MSALPPLPNPLEAAASARPRHPAVIEASSGATLSFADLRDRAATLAGRLAAAGVLPGDPVAIEGPPSAAWAIAFHAAGWLGAVAAPLPVRVPPAERAARLAVLAPRLLLRVPADGGVRLEPLPDGPSPPAGAGGRASAREGADWPLEAVRARVTTSGTTGSPRVAELTTLQVLLNAFGSAIRLGLDPGDRWLACLPLHHVGGLAILWRSLFYGTTVLLHPRFDPAAVAADLDAGRASLVSLVPEMLRRVLDRQGDRPFHPRVRAVLVGGASLPPALAARCRALGIPLASTWGMTETASQVATTPPGEVLGPGDVGPPLPFARVRAEPGGGALHVEGPLAPGGHLRTGDRGAVREGRVRVDGRLDDLIVSGGENIDPAEVEAVLEAHPAVAESRVLPRPHPRWGQRPHALLRACGERPADAELDAWCRARLAPFKVPDGFTWVDRLPRTALGKRVRRWPGEDA